MTQSVRHIWINPDFLRDQPEQAGYALAGKAIGALNDGSDIVVVLIGDRDKASAFEDRFFMYGPPDPDISYGD